PYVCEGFSQDSGNMHVRENVKRLLRGFLVIATIFILCGAGYFWVLAPERPPPDHLSDLLSTAPALSDAKSGVETFYREKGSFKGVSSVQVAEPPIDPLVVRSLRVDGTGNVILDAAVRVPHRSDRELVTLIWSPHVQSEGGQSTLRWSCKG